MVEGNERTPQPDAGDGGFGGVVLKLAMTRIQCCGILFDMDGVLVDSTPAVARVWSYWAGQHGMDAGDVVRRAHGRPSITTIRELLPDADHEAENNEVERREIEDVEGVVAIPGATALLATLPAGSWTVVTSATKALAIVRIGAGGLPLPEKFITADDITRGKPDPEPYLKGARLLGFEPKDCVVIEDAPAGIRAGKAAGARVIALRTTAEDSELIRAGADWIVEDLRQISVRIETESEKLEVLLNDEST
jgi:mannitol-1-/sugar-/sorbitol-6-phosphatase